MTDLEQKELIHALQLCEKERYRVRITLKSGNVVGGPETLVWAIGNGFVQLVTSQPPKEGEGALVSSSSYAHIPISHIDFFEKNFGK